MNAFVKPVAVTLSNILAGNDVRDVQKRHAVIKLVPLLKSNKGKEVSDEQPYHALRKIVPLLTSNKGKEVNSLLSLQYWEKPVTSEKSQSLYVTSDSIADFSPALKLLSQIIRKVSFNGWSVPLALANKLYTPLIDTS